MQTLIHLRVSAPALIVAVVAVLNARSASIFERVPLPVGNGYIAGAAFSPDSRSLSIVTASHSRGEHERKRVLHLIELRSMTEVHAADVDSPDADNSWPTTLIEYSADGHYVMFAAEGSDALSLFDTKVLKVVRRVLLHPENSPRILLGPRHDSGGIISLATARNTSAFAALTYDRKNGNEVFEGDIASGKVESHWNIGPSYAATSLGDTSLSLTPDASKTAVWVLPFDRRTRNARENVRLYDSHTGELLRTFRAMGRLGRVWFHSNDELLLSRIDAPGLFSKKTCIEVLNIESGVVEKKFCDSDRNVLGFMAIAPETNRIAALAFQIHKDIEGDVYSAPARIDVWDADSGALTAKSQELDRAGFIKMSNDGHWIMAGGTLMRVRLGARPANHHTTTKISPP